MYAVTEEYKSAMKEPVQQYKLRGSIGDVNITGENVRKGSLSIINQCSDEQKITLGSVYVGELKAVFTNVDIDRYAWKGREISLEQGLEISDDTYEYAPLGIYNIEEATYERDGVSVTAYDRMSYFDKTANISFTNGTPYELLTYACEACGVPLGMSEMQIKTFANGSRILGLYATNDIETWRDFLYWVAQTLGAVATINRFGELILVSYSQNIVDTIDNRHRFVGAGFSDYETAYSGVYLTNAEDNTMKYYGDKEDTGLTLSLGANPFIQYGTDEVKEEMCREILNSLANIRYVPYEAELLPSAAVYDLGDVLCFSEGIADGNKMYCVNKLSYTFNKSCVLTGVGENPALASAKSKTDKNLQGLANNASSKEIQFYEFVNASDITIGDENRIMVMSLRALSNSSVKAQFNAEILCEAICDEQIIVTVNYERDNVVVDYVPVETWSNGKHILSLFFMIDLAENSATQWDVYISVSGGSLSIPKGNARAVIYGQGLATTLEWDGKITLEQSFDVIDLGPSIEIVPFDGEFDVRLIDPHVSDINERMNAIQLNSISIASFEEHLIMNRSGASHETWYDMMAYTWDEAKEGYTWI